MLVPWLLAQPTEMMTALDAGHVVAGLVLLDAHGTSGKKSPEQQEKKMSEAH
jgi:hypothetical protein